MAVVAGALARDGSVGDGRAWIEFMNLLIIVATKPSVGESCVLPSFCAASQRFSWQLMQLTTIGRRVGHLGDVGVAVDALPAAVHAVLELVRVTFSERIVPFGCLTPNPGMP